MAALAAGCSGEAAPPTSTGEVLPSISTSGGSSMSTSSTAGTSGTSSGASSGASTASTSTSSPSTSEASAASGSVTENATTFDVGWDKDFDDPTPAGCQGKIDFLFVLSEHGTLKDEHAELAVAFPKWIETIESKFESFDVHIMVVGSDEFWGGYWCNESCEQQCMYGDECCSLNVPPGDQGELCCQIEDFPCSLMNLVTACDETLGAGVVFPAGQEASNEPCKFVGGHRYMTSEEPDLAEAFTCAARLGWGGYNRGGDALMQAISPSLNGPGGCNEGFLRDDALLMITWLAPGFDDSKNVVYQWEWYDAVVEAKHGDPGSVIALSLSNIECPKIHDEPCQFAKLFPHHVIGDCCDEPYAPAFDEATDLVEAACEAFIPQ